MKKTQNNISGVRQPIRCWCAVLTGLALTGSIVAGQAQNVIVDQFNNATSAAEVAAWSCTSIPWGVTAPAPTFSANDAQGSASSGSIKFIFPYGVGTGSQNTNVNVQFTATAPPSTDLSRATFLEFDMMVDPSSPTDPNGNIAYFQFGVGGKQIAGFWYGPWGIPFTSGVWQHFKIAIPAGTFTGSVSQFFINPYQNNMTAPTTEIIYMDNIVIDVPLPTYPNFTAFAFDSSGSVTANNATAGVGGGDSSDSTGIGWYGDPTTIIWDGTQNSTIPNPSVTPAVGSGAAHIVATWLAANDNSDIVGLFFDTNYFNEADSPPNFPASPTNAADIIDGTHYSQVEMDVLWDTNLSTISITNFNAMGDIAGAPLGLALNPNAAQVEAMSSTVNIPDAASNGWVHLVFPINKSAGGLSQTIGLWFKKYSNLGTTGTAAFWIDNVVFDGGLIAVPSPTLTIAHAVQGLQTVSTGQSTKNATYDRENLVTFNNAYSFADNPSPITYSIKLAYVPPYNPGASGQYISQIILVPLGSGVPGTDTEPDYNYPTLLIGAIQRNSSTNMQFQLQCKTNQAGGNGSLFDSSNSNTTWIVNSPAEGNWSMTISGNTQFTITAPNGSSTNLPFPLGLNSSAVSSWFDSGLGMVAYFGSQNNGSANQGGRVVLANATISGSVPYPTVGGAITYAPVNDNFLTDTSILLSTGAGDTIDPWLVASDASVQTNGNFLLPHTVNYWLDWALPANGFVVQTNGNPTASSAWATNSGLSPLLLGTHYHIDVDNSSLISGGTGNEFFRLNNNPSQ